MMRIKKENKSEKTKSDFLLVLTFQTHYLDYQVISMTNQILNDDIKK